ncbi:hypothetical protein GCM10011482_08700 [Enterococcus alcedinis]|uniref:Uncharacterized protein n=1 Tax=Enterococcus alcedinis TaxID=1274384 RepID=A0A917JGC9_9ENTE|nr:hypothetical protein GCM10011482_08700 [Enterococcus alcedinis]
MTLFESVERLKEKSILDDTLSTSFYLSIAKIIAVFNDNDSENSHAINDFLLNG